MKEYLPIVIESYRCSSLNWKFMTKEISIMTIIFGCLPVAPLAIVFRIVDSLWIATVILLPIIIHYIVYYVVIKEKLSKFETEYEDTLGILDFYIIETSKYWTKYRFYKFISELEQKCKEKGYNIISVVNDTKQYVKNLVELSGRKEQIVNSPRRSLTLWLLAPVIGIFTAIFHNVTTHAIDKPNVFVLVFILAYLFSTFIFIILEIVKKEYNSDYQKLELLNFMECALILMRPYESSQQNK